MVNALHLVFRFGSSGLQIYVPTTGAIVSRLCVLAFKLTSQLVLTHGCAMSFVTAL